MSRKIIAVNAGPRKGWNTDTLISEATKGAESTGAVVERFDLFRLERYTGLFYQEVYAVKERQIATGAHLPFCCV